MLLAHLSDPHLTTGPLAGGPAAGLHAALGRLLGLPTRPDAAVITGDLTDHGHPGEYHQLTELLTGIPLPVYLAAGNHDNRGALLDTFAGTPQLAGGDEAHYAADLPGATLLVLDSLIPGQGAGRVGTDQLAWLDTVLSQRPETPALVAVHHPPVPVGIPSSTASGYSTPTPSPTWSAPTHRSSGSCAGTSTAPSPPRSPEHS